MGMNILEARRRVMMEQPHIETLVGNPVSFKAEALPLQELKVAITPVQDLHGQDAPYPAGGGKNICPPFGNYSANGLTTTANSDGSITVSGEAEGTGGYITDFVNFSKTVPSGTPFSISITSAISAKLRQFFDEGTSDIQAGSTSTVRTGSYDTTKMRLYLFTTAGTSYNFTIKVQVEVGSTATDWSPYANICPISGHTGVNVYHSGEDTTDPTVYPITWETAAWTVYGGTLDVVNGVLTVDRAIVHAKDMNWARSSSARNPNGTVYTASESVPFKRWGSVYDKSISNALVHASAEGNLGAEAANTFWWNNARTAYRAVWGKPNVGSTKEEFVQFLTDNDVVFLSELATPTTFTLSAQQISSLLGMNNLWNDINGNNAVSFYTH